MQCPNCGASLRDNAVFCSSCGQRVTSQTMQTPAPPPAQTWETGENAGGRGPAGAPWMNEGATGAGGGARRGAARGGSGRGAGLGGGRPGMDALTGRLSRLARLDTSVFREVRDDPAALVPAAVVAGVAILLMALGGWLWWVFEGGDLIDKGEIFVKSVIVGTILGGVLWAAWVWLTSVLLTRVFHRQATFIGLLAPMGLAAAPLAIGLLMFIDVFHTALGVGCIAAAAMLTQIAVQEATDATPGEAFVANLAGLGLWLIALGLLSQGSADFGPGIFSVPAFDIPSFGDLFN